MVDIVVCTVDVIPNHDVRTAVVVMPAQFRQFGHAGCTVAMFGQYRLCLVQFFS